MMYTEDLQYLKRATPAELMNMTNGIPWTVCCWIKAELTHPGRWEQEADREIAKWRAAGAVGDYAEFKRWLHTDQESCAECRLALKSERRVTFTREHGFAWLNLCGQCCQDFDYHYDFLKAMATARELAKRWQGRSLAPKVVTQ
jgi:hypothetical protein